METHIEIFQYVHVQHISWTLLHLYGF